MLVLVVVPAAHVYVFIYVEHACVLDACFVVSHFSHIIGTGATRCTLTAAPRRTIFI